ncbi:flavocytochrome c [Breznakiella homolactica]|uniref:Urocanate reductase n=1 Tax=Breznakiella homolactica TaxID=2798577 RepID=A0A7T8B9N6_9SPIR|nr:flavocytochrome c [Breznakiella homolactica]QQO07383.1 flavocytochrome c [Breznakiella homolactica]
MKKVPSKILALLMAVSVFGCVSSKTGFTPGTYQGTAQGFHGDITMEVTVDSGRILSVQAVEHTESPGISDPAFERIPKAIVDGQTLAVDVVAGASFSSRGIIDAVTLALEKSGADITALQNKTASSKAVRRDSKTETADVIVIGAGGAGLAAAIAANQSGATVIVLEKMPRAGGNTIISGAAYNAVDPSRQIPLGIEDSVDLHFTQTYEGGDKVGDPALVRTMVENAYPALQWMESLGMEFTPTVFTVLGGLWPRAHKPVKPLGTGYIDTDLEYINSHSSQITLLLETEATELITKNGRVTGVKAKGLSTDYVFNANKAVVIATGGFGANIELRDRFNSMWPALTNIKTTNHPGATGDGLVMAEAVGANLVGMEYIQLLPMGDPDTGSLSGNIEQNVENRIFVNKSGNRFVDEGARRDVMTKGLFEQQDAFMWVILDRHSYPNPDVKNNFNETIAELIAQGRAYGANSLDDLARQIGVNAENLKAAVADFNRAVETGGPDRFGRTLFQDKIDTPPFYAGAREPTVHHTMGGIQINTRAQAIDKKGNVIPGLYAAGEVTGGIHGSNRLGGNALADIHVFGRIAGTNAAAEK